MENALEQIHGLKQSLTAQLAEKTDKNDFLDFRVKVFAELEEKTDLNEVQTALNAC